MRFTNRRQAGLVLADHISAHQPIDPLILALPRGGVPVGYQVAASLRCDLDVLVVRKIGVPHQPELAMGAVSEGEVVVRNDRIVDASRIVEATFESLVESARHQLRDKLKMYREGLAPIDPSGRLCVIVDDGLATGSSARAAIRVLRERAVSEVWLAVPVAPEDTVEALTQVADRVVVSHVPQRFGSVGAWYRDFRQTTDLEVQDLLAKSRLR